MRDTVIFIVLLSIIIAAMFALVFGAALKARNEGQISECASGETRSPRGLERAIT
jgi:hypothetical protein